MFNIKHQQNNNGYYLFIWVFISLFTCTTNDFPTSLGKYSSYSTLTERNLHYYLTEVTDCGNFNINLYKT